MFICHRDKYELYLVGNVQTVSKTISLALYKLSFELTVKIYFHQRHGRLILVSWHHVWTDLVFSRLSRSTRTAPYFSRVWHLLSLLRLRGCESKRAFVVEGHRRCRSFNKKERRSSRRSFHSIWIIIRDITWVSVSEEWSDVVRLNHWWLLKAGIKRLSGMEREAAQRCRISVPSI